MERAYPGFIAFVPIFPVHTGDKPLDLGQLLSAVRASKDPGPAPDLAALMPTIVGQTTKTTWKEVKSKRFQRWLAGVMGIGLALFLLTAGPFGPLFALVASVASVLVAFIPLPEVKEELKKLTTARENWTQATRDFQQIAGNTRFLHLRNEAETLIARLQQLSSEESLRFAELTNKKRELQLHHFLEQHDIEQVRIKGISNGRKLTLKSYGIETAANIDYRQIVAIAGFGPATANVLLDWRRNLEAKFHFNPNQSIDPAAVNAIKAEFANKRAGQEALASHILADLQKAATEAVAVRSNAPVEASDAWIALRRAQDFEQSFRPTVGEAVQLFSLAAVLFTSFIAYSNLTYLDFHIPFQSKLGNISRSAPGVEVAPQPTALRPEASGPSTPAPSTHSPDGTQRIVPTPATSAPQRASGPEVPVTNASPYTETGPPPDLLDPSSALRVQDRLRTLGYTRDAPDGFWGSRSRNALRDFRRTKGLGGDDLWDSETEKALMGEDAPSAGTHAMLQPAPAEARYPPPSGATRNPLNRADALWIQGRLRELGFYFGNTDGIWGLNSRRALQAFKTKNGLTADYEWDAPTEAKLANPKPDPNPSLGRAPTSDPTAGGLY
jgi:peptidoglycan hydrolase-like protein with peptidoglycan-binding domain